MQNIFSCQRCGTKNKFGIKSCKSCGMEFQYSCPQCRFPVKGGDIVCGRCGNRLSWPAGTEGSTGQITVNTQKQNKRSWLGPLLGLIIVLLLGSVGAYIVIKLYEKPGPAAIVTNMPATNTKEEVVPADTTPPVISDIQVTSISSDSVVISWVTDELSTSQVIWNAKNGTTNTTQNKEAMVQKHSVELTGLKIKTVFYFKVRSMNQSGHETVSEQKTFDTGKQTGVISVAIAKSSMIIEEKPPLTGVRTYVRGLVENTGELPVEIANIEVTIKITVPGTMGTSEVLALFDPYPTAINPGETHKFYAVVPNNTNPDYKVSARVLDQ